MGEVFVVVFLELGVPLFVLSFLFGYFLLFLCFVAEKAPATCSFSLWLFVGIGKEVPLCLFLVSLV